MFSAQVFGTAEPKVDPLVMPRAELPRYTVIVLSVRLLQVFLVAH